MRYFLLNTMGSDDPKLYFVDKRPKGLGTTSWRMAAGVKISDQWPAEPPPVYPSDDCVGTKLPAMIGNTLRYFLISTEVRKIVEEHCRNVDVEYLPVTLFNKKKREQSRDYCLVNPLGTFDCLDPERSEIVYSKSGSGEVVSVESFVLDETKLEGVPPLFRVKHDARRYFFSEPLGRALGERTFSNLLVYEVPVSPRSGR